MQRVSPPATFSGVCGNGAHYGISNVTPKFYQLGGKKEDQVMTLRATCPMCVEAYEAQCAEDRTAANSAGRQAAACFYIKVRSDKGRELKAFFETAVRPTPRARGKLAKKPRGAQAAPKATKTTKQNRRSERFLGVDAELLAC